MDAARREKEDPPPRGSSLPACERRCAATPQGDTGRLGIPRPVQWEWGHHQGGSTDLHVGPTSLREILDKALRLKQKDAEIS